MASAAQSANDSAKQVAAGEPVKIGARIGLVAYAITQLLIAWLALQTALGNGGQDAVRPARCRRWPSSRLGGCCGGCSSSGSRRWRCAS